MRKGQTRLAQVWAKLLMERIDQTIKEQIEASEGDYTKVFPLSLSLPISVPGSGIRMCQEVNLAKKQQDQMEFAKKEERQQKLDRILAQGGEAGMVYSPKIISWVLKTKSIENGMVSFFAEQPTGKKRSKGVMLSIAMEYVNRMDTLQPADKPAKPDPFAHYLEGMADEQILPEEKRAVERDAQDDVITQYLHQGEKP